MCRSQAEGGRRCPSAARTRARNARTRARLTAIAATAPASAERLYGGTTSDVTLITTPDGQRAVRKAARPHTDPGDALEAADAEELAALLGDEIGAPVAQVHRDGPDSLLIEYIDGGHAEDAQQAALADTCEAARLGLLDAMTGNGDRKGNLMLRDGQLVGIDHGAAWLYAELGYTEPVLSEPDAPMARYVAQVPGADDNTGTWRTDPPIGVADVARIRARAEALRPVFEARGRGTWLDYSLNVLDGIGQHAAKPGITPGQQGDTP